ncbi:MAG: hydantoinase B/oxoprolinase family protein [Actinomycetota bacterium]
MSQVEKPRQVDPITFEVVRRALIATSNEMALVVAKSAYSTPVNEGRDFAGTVYDQAGRLVSQGEFDIPGLVGVTQLTVPEVIDSIGIENMEEGDVYMVNDPYVASTHCNDVHLVKPIFHSGDLVAFVASSAHWSDVGGVAPGSLNCWAQTFFEEGIRVPTITIYKRGELNQDVMRVLLANMRSSWERLGDFNAQVSALSTGESRIHAIINRHGLQTLTHTMSETQDHSERLIRAYLSEIPDGTYRAEDRVDQDLATGEPKVIRLELTITGDQAILDFRESDEAARSGINCTLSATTSAVFISLASVMPPMPMNAGVMRPVDLLVTKGSLLWAQPPSAVSGLGATSMECVIGCVTRALSHALPERGAATPFSILNAVFAGHDSRPGFGEEFINYSWGFGGLGGTKLRDGASVVGSSYTASTQNIPCELQERRYPVLWERYMFLDDSGGPGMRRGGVGCDQLISFPYQDATVSCIGNRERFGPPGVFGGKTGGRARLVLNPDAEGERNIGIFAVNEPVKKGEVLSFWSAGGGGYGDPLQREPELVLEDVIDGFVSVEAARSNYGVVIREIDRRTLAFEVDGPATRELRAQMRELAEEVVPQ